ncbi:pectate lyase family protein [Haloglycomyces albus]|uniref:pectate lyase family protein n=1 Tax=Haloglycomyces albus TaxID=526067 RepID=UPI0004A3C5AD|nr:pectate lyase [Haloglycomyces albus]
MRPIAKRLVGVGATVALIAGIGGVALTSAHAETGGPEGFAAQNGGTTGGADGQTVSASTGTEIHAALCDRASSDTPIVIEVEGTINHGNTSKVSGDSCNTADDKIELKEISNVTLVGVGDGALFDELGIHLRDSSNIIIQNVHVRNVKKSGSPTSNGGDAIGMESNVRNVWVDHATLEASGGESAGYDGLFDLKNNTQYVTLSYSILRNSGRGGLIGSSNSDTTNGFTTFHHNRYENIDSRTPLLRAGTAHSYNNHYVGLTKSGINSRVDAEIQVDHNYFQDSRDVLGTFYTDHLGYWEVNDNIYDNVTWSSDDSDNHPAGPNPTSTTSVDIPYEFELDEANCVPDIVAGTAGANTGLQVSNGSCAPQDSSPEPTTDPTVPPNGDNLSIGAGSDGSTKASGTSFRNVRDGDMDTYWSPTSSTGRISIKWDTDTTVTTINIRETPNTEGTIESWQVVNHDNGDILAVGTGAGPINVPATTLTKINFVITTSNGTPQIAEFETFSE